MQRFWSQIFVLVKSVIKHIQITGSSIIRTVRRTKAGDSNGHSSSASDGCYYRKRGVGDFRM